MFIWCMRLQQLAVHSMTCMQNPSFFLHSKATLHLCRCCILHRKLVYTVVCVTYVYQNASSLVAAAAAQVLLSLHVLLAPSVPIDACVV